MAGTESYVVDHANVDGSEGGKVFQNVFTVSLTIEGEGRGENIGKVKRSNERADDVESHQTPPD